MLLILVAVASLALRSTEGLVQQGRFDSTQRTLVNVEAGVLGSEGLRQPDGTPIVGGFLADVGRLPVAGSPAGLQELLTRPETVDPYSVQVFPDDAEISLGTGWRGPYVRLPPGSALEIRDGWGNPIQPTDASGALGLAAADSIAGLLSQGSDSAGGGSGYANDQRRLFPDLSTTTVHVTVERADGTALATQPILIVLYGPDPSSASSLGGTPHTVTPLASQMSVSHYFQTTPGPKVLRAYQGATVSFSSDLGSTRTRVAHVVVLPRGPSPSITLKLP